MHPARELQNQNFIEVFVNKRNLNELSQDEALSRYKKNVFFSLSPSPFLSDRVTSSAGYSATQASLRMQRTPALSLTSPAGMRSSRVSTRRRSRALRRSSRTLRLSTRSAGTVTRGATSATRSFSTSTPDNFLWELFKEFDY